MCSLNFLRIALYRLLHSQRGVAGANTVVLVGQGRSEQRHDPVAQHLADRPLIAMDGFHHPLQDRIENPARFLRVAIGDQFHRSLHIGEQHGNLLALALLGGLRREDHLGEPLPGIAFRYGPHAGRFLRQRSTAGAAGVIGGNIGRPAGRTADFEARATFRAELSARWVVVLTVLTPHAAGITPEATEAGLALAIENVFAFLAGKAVNVVV